MRYDPAGDGRSGPYGDMVRAKVRFNYDRTLTKVRVQRAHSQGYYTNVRVDVDIENPGPEFLMVRNSDSYPSVAEVYRVNTWDDFPFGKPVRCRVRAPESDSGRLLTWRANRTCFRYLTRLPRTIRVNVQTEEDTWYGDHVPGARTWSRWIKIA